MRHSFNKTRRTPPKFSSFHPPKSRPLQTWTVKRWCSSRPSSTARLWSSKRVHPPSLRPGVPVPEISSSPILSAFKISPNRYPLPLLLPADSRNKSLNHSTPQTGQQTCKTLVLLTIAWPSKQACTKQHKTICNKTICNNISSHNNSKYNIVNKPWICSPYSRR